MFDGEYRFSENLKVFYYWYISNDPAAIQARTHGIIPIGIVDDLSRDELSAARKMIYRKIKEDNCEKVHLQFLAEYGNVSSIPILKDQLINYRQKSEENYLCDFSDEIRLCSTALRRLHKLVNQY